MARARARLRDRLPPPDTSASREARWLTGLALGLSEAQVLARADQAVDALSLARFEDLLARRAKGEPFAYLAGQREFYGREFAVDRRVLVPRPETEHLVEAILQLPLPPLSKAPRVLDFCTGSGAVAVTVALERLGCRVTATDLSLPALAVARLNARRLGARVDFVCADLELGLALGDFDVVAANPPYVAIGDPQLDPAVAAHEPPLALYAADSGFAMLDRLLALRPALKRGAHLVVELGAGQADRIETRARAAGYDLARLERDLAGHRRIAVFRRS